MEMWGGWGCRGLVLVIAIGTTACGDGPAQPGLPISEAALTLEVLSGANQSALIGSSVAVEPAVVVRNLAGVPQPGVLVRFSVMEGGGSVALQSAITDAGGVARSGVWVLGPFPGTNVLEAAVDQVIVRFVATAESPFVIEVRWVGSATPRQKAVVSEAIARWRRVVLSELTDVPVRSAAGACFESQPALDETVDDLLLFVEFVSIDGPMGVLGHAGPCFVRNESDMPVIGSITLDAADLQQADVMGMLDDIVLHEIGHVLGFGTIWGEKGLLTGARGDDPRFTGAQALTAYRATDPSHASVPVENSGSKGTRDGHWRDSVFGRELMTGYLNGAPNPLSTITIGSLADLGYATHFGAADVYSVSGPATALLPAPPLADLARHEVLRYPRYGVDRRGVGTEIR
jgi:hypothetical protein